MAHIRQGGVAKPTNFRVYIYEPPAKTQNVAVANYFNEYGLQDNQSLRKLALSCEIAELPGKLNATTENRHFGPAFKVPYVSIQDDVQMTFRLSEDMYERKFFEAWMASIIDPVNNQMNFYKEYVSTIDIVQTDNNGYALYGIRMIEAYPIGLTPLSVDWSANDTYHKQNVLFTFRKWEPLYFNVESNPSTKVPSPYNIFKNVFKVLT